MDRYSDLMYLGAAALSVIGSIFAAHLHQGDPRSRRKRPANSRPPFSTSASGWSTPTLDELEELQDELETILRGAVIGLRDGTI